MLVLARRVGQKICIGPNIVLTVTAICGDQVKLGWEAPEHIEIDRQEVRQSKQQHGRQRPVNLFAGMNTPQSPLAMG